ncbi:MAG: polyphosphate kinase 1 [Bacteroidales bacterium]|nr:polyphosphate kinase 1 [Bacteroidales bacterium]
MKKVQNINREISWLSFNERVLQEAADERVPLIERLRFLGIYSNNLDEFYRVRVATLRRISDFSEDIPEDMPYDPAKILKKINDIEQKQQEKFSSIYQELLAELETHNIFLVNEKELTPEQGEFVTRFFEENVRPNLFPIMIKNFKRSSFLRDRAIYLAVHLQKIDKSLRDDSALIRVPAASISRFVLLPRANDRQFIILLDDVIRYNLASIFSIFNYDKFEAYSIKLTRDAELDIDNDVSKSFMERMTESLKQRRQGRPVRFIYDEAMPKSLMKMLAERLKISEKDNMHHGGRYHNFKDFMTFPNVEKAHLEYPPMPPLPHSSLAGAKSMLAAMQQKDIMLHFPYQSFHYIVDLLREASIDPRVRSIKMTLYRVAKNSKVINALINAARNGKKVTVFLELQARFDEKANIYWSEKMQEEGVEIIHGVPGLKVHSKLILIKRKEGKKTMLYANIGTGNFNEETAGIYGDDSLLTCNPHITEEVDKVFSLFEKTWYAPVNFRHLIVSPFRTRNFVVQQIEREIKNARAGQPAAIFLKLNSLVDEAIVKKLYAASKAGVKCRLIVRGICVLIPGKPGLSENIEVISIVDRFLEHSRVFVFHNDGDEKYYISSADMMTRNLDHRIEVGCPVLDPDIQQELRNMLELQWKDNVKARIVDGRQQNHYRVPAPGEIPVRSQEAIYQYFWQLLNKG